MPGVVVGVGSDVPANPQPARFRGKFNIRGPFAIYVGRIDENKGCAELFEFFQAYANSGAGRLSLVLIGHSLLPIPKHPRIHHLGYLEDSDKFDAMMAADLLIMPSYFESLSMVALEAWALGRPVLANAKCDVLKGQCIRSNAGLYYDGSLEFVETLRAIEQNRWLSGSLGRAGRTFFRDHYDWSVIDRKSPRHVQPPVQGNGHARDGPAARMVPTPLGRLSARCAGCGGHPVGTIFGAEPATPVPAFAGPRAAERPRQGVPRPSTFQQRRGPRRDRPGSGPGAGRA